MTTALAHRQDLLPDASKLKTMMELAGQLVQSGLLPQAIKSPAAALAIIQKGQELGIPPMYALSNIGIINGKPVVGAEVMLAMIYRDHGDQAIQFEDTSGDRCSVVYKRRSWTQARRFEWTIEDAKKAGLLGKGGPWSQYQPAMLRARCISAVARLAFPDSIGGMHTPEELGAEVAVTDDGAIEVIQPPATVVSIVPSTDDVSSGSAAGPKWEGLGTPIEPAGPSDRARLERRQRQLGQAAIDRQHPKAEAINATAPEDLTDAQLARSVKRLEELFPDVAPESDDEEAF